MNVLDTNIPPNRRPAMRLDNEDGLWAISVAETPYDARAYSLYIKTPTHNLTLTRTAMEIVDLDRKLRDSHPGQKIPAVPIDPATMLPPPKRKSNFLNTLSRLASPTSNKVRNRSSSRRENSHSNISSTLPTPPLTSPASEGSDPFTAIEPAEVATATPSSPSATSTAIAAYLTTISNIAVFRKDRVWKRFVRVRTDDLESVRVERAIKHVRSDLAAHVGGGGLGGGNRTSVLVKTEEASAKANQVSEAEKSLPSPEDDIETPASEQKGAEGQGEEVHHDRDATAVPEKRQEDGDVEMKVATGSEESTTAGQGHEEDEAPATPMNERPSSALARNLPRSQSAEPDKSHRVTRTYASSVPSQDGMSSTVETGDESSFSAAGSRRRRNKKKAKKVGGLSTRKVTVADFEMMRVLGKGCAGKVLLVRHKGTAGLFALKAITKRHVLAHQELQHTLTEQAVLKRMAAESKDPFVVKLWWSFHDKENLFLVMDFHPGGDLATQLARWGRLSRDRTRFYAAEIVEGVEGLHAAGVIYRDLKPENILIAGDGHIVLTDFGLSKEFPRKPSSNGTVPLAASESNGSDFYSSAPGTPQTVLPPWQKTDKNGEMLNGWPGQPIGCPDVTTTFCGTAEYLAPEVIQGLQYSYEVDWWSFGTMLYEMLTGITPFYANNHSDMYVRVLQDELQFPDDRVMDQDTKSLIRGLLQRNPDLRIREPRIKKHPYFSMIDWTHVYYKRYIPPYVPPVDPTMAYDTQNFDETFLDMEPVLDEYNDEAMETDQEPQTDTERTDGEESNTTPSQSRSSSIRPLARSEHEEDETVDVFDGYSFKGRHSIIMDDDAEEEGSDDGSYEGESAEDDASSSVLTGETQSETATLDEAGEEQQEDVGEPKTPEARPVGLPPTEVQPPVPDVAPTPVEEVKPLVVAPKPKVEKVVKPTRQEEEAADEEDLAQKAALAAAVLELQDASKRPDAQTKSRPPLGGRATHKRREKSGIPALDKDLDDDVNMTEPERDEEDDDWDFIEAGDGEDKNGAKATSLWARGVVDRYKLSVFRKSSTPSGGRSVSGVSKAPQASEVTESPSPSHRRGRTGGINFRKNPRQFLRPKSPPSTMSNNTGRSFSQTANSLSAASGPSNGFLTPNMSPSLKSKESAVSMGGQSASSDQSGNVVSPTTPSAAQWCR
ncbi:AGC/AGC-unique protein kinase [Ephemerocybe angulata]|uniref:non-specific serine/threonine protein kinase n=1 Tax=Ephemerocybe angulata TaxID=980116 RepID=A0A8H6HL06_9AGAR|nr:AGC/AGC-unique protein kinase [Tulosesus angulatus]